MLVLNDDQRMIRDAAEGFFAEQAPVSQLRRLRDSNDEVGFSRDLWKSMAEMGFAGVLIAEEFGGVGMGHVAAGVIEEAIGRNLSRSPFLSTAVLGASAIAGAGSADQKRSILPGIASGEKLLTLAADEVSRHRPGHVETVARASGNGFLLNGRKTFVFDAHVADYLIVSARTSGGVDDRAGLTLFLVDPAAKGVTLNRRTSVDTHHVAQVTFDNVQIDGADVLGEVGGGWPILDRVLDAGRACLAAEMLGVSGRSFAMTLDYLKQREQFGVKIGSFQALQHRAAHLFSQIELARSVCLRSLQALDAGEAEAPMLVSLAKGKVGEVAKLATNEAVQMHGGIGMTDEFDLGFFMKRVRVANETFGDIAFHGDRMASMLGY